MSRPARGLLECLIAFLLLVQSVFPLRAQNPTSDIRVAGTAGLATPGGSVTYVLALYNHTDRPLSNGAVRYAMPDGFTYVPGSTRVTVGGHLLSTADPTRDGATLHWSPFTVPAAGHTLHTPRGIHTMAQDLCLPEFIDLHLDQALQLVGSGGYVTQLFYGITAATTGPDACARYFVNAAYDRNLVPVLRLQGRFVSGVWEKPDPGPAGDYGAVAQGFARYVAGLPRRDTHPLYIAVWNEPNLWIEWSGAPNAIEYARFFTAVSRAIRRLGDARIRVVNGAVAPGSGHLNFIRSMLTVPGFVDAFDAWASHCYPYNHPPWYNMHARTARYGEYAIDCYLLEKEVIERHGGRSGFKFLITETGYELGNATFAFEGFPAVDEHNRADYMADAFRRWWPAWPEVIAVTPFQLGDPWSGWERYDWIDYAVSLNPRQIQFSPRLQYTVVSALSKPRGETVARSVQVSFQARVASDAVPDRTYFGTLCGAARGVQEVCTVAAPVRVVASLQPVYLPLIARPPQTSAPPRDGVWYLAGPSTPAGGPDEKEGVVQPTTFLGGAALAAQSLPSAEPVIPAAALPPDAAWLAWVGDAQAAWVAVVGRRGEVAVADLARAEVFARAPLADPPRALAAGPQPGMLYVASDAGDIRCLDARTGDTLAQFSDAHLQVSAMRYDPLERTLLVADAAAPAVVRLAADLARLLTRQALPDLPGAMMLDAERRRVYVGLPGSNQVVALDATTLQPVAQQRLPGGPLLAVALDHAHNRLYGLSAASPRQRVIAVLDAATLRPLALVAGTFETPLRQATALVADWSGRLWVAEGERLYGIDDHYTVVETVPLARPLHPTMLLAPPQGAQVVWMDAAGLCMH
ncbi:MAG: hypothetical protein NZ765_08395 [Anaerolineae bacterium]|nr:hypothetical protein [Anaerolineae bacterium]